MQTYDMTLVEQITSYVDFFFDKTPTVPAHQKRPLQTALNRIGLKVFQVPLGDMINDWLLSKVPSSTTATIKEDDDSIATLATMFDNDRNVPFINILQRISNDEKLITTSKEVLLRLGLLRIWPDKRLDGVEPQRTLVAKSITSIITSPTKLKDIINMIDECITQKPEFASQRNILVQELTDQASSSEDHFSRGRMDEDDKLCDNHGKRIQHQDTCNDPSLGYSIYRYDDQVETECTDEHGHVQHTLSRNIPELVDWLKENNKLFIDTSLHDIIKGSSFSNWNWAIAEDPVWRTYMFNVVAVEDIYELGTKHVMLANGMNIYAAGEMIIDRVAHTVRYNFNSSNIRDVQTKFVLQIQTWNIFKSMLPDNYALINDQLLIQMSHLCGIAYKPTYFDFYTTKQCMKSTKEQNLRRWLIKHESTFSPSRQINIRDVYRKNKHKHRAGEEALMFLEPETKDQYEEKSVLGSGSYGDVKEVIKTSTGERYAIKEYKQSSSADLNEIDLLCKMDHPNILHAHEIIKDGSTLKIVLPIADMNLRQYITTKLNGPPTDLSMVVSIMFQILSAVLFFHKQGYFHCDLKPDNILMFGDKPVVSDFGWSLAIGTDTGNTCGTHTYASGQCLGNLGFMHHYYAITDAPCNHVQSDIHALGCIMYALLYHKNLIGHITEYKYNTKNTAYDKLAKLLTPYINQYKADGSNKELTLTLKCIYFMTVPTQKNRHKTIEQVLEKEEIFKLFGHTTPIGGRIRIPSTSNVCHVINHDKHTVAGACITLLNNLNDRRKFSLFNMCILPPLLARSIHALGYTKWLKYKECATLAVQYIARNISDHGGRTVKGGAGCNVRLVERVVNENVVDLQGCLTVPSIYMHTTNALACVWFTLLCLSQDCSYMFAHPEKLMEMFTSSNPSITNIDKSDILHVEFTHGNDWGTYMEMNYLYLLHHHKAVVTINNTEGKLECTLDSNLTMHIHKI